MFCHQHDEGKLFVAGEWLTMAGALVRESRSRDNSQVENSSGMTPSRLEAFAGLIELDQKLSGQQVEKMEGCKYDRL